MDVALFGAPTGNLFQPYSALPALSAWLRRHGLTVHQRDLGIALYDWLLSSKHLEAEFEGMRHGIERLQRAGEPLLLCDQIRTLRLLRYSGMSALSADVDEAKRILRDGARFYDAEQFDWAIHRLDDALGVCSVATHPRMAFHMDTIAVHPRYQGSLGAAVRFAQEVVDGPMASFFEREAVPVVSEGKPHVVGIAVSYDVQIWGALSIAMVLRRSGYRGRIVLGGRAISKFPDAFRTAPELFDLVDGVFLGESEEGLTTYVQRAAAGESPEGVPGLVHRVGDEVRVGNPVSVEDLDVLPPPDYEGFNFRDYLGPEVVPLFPLNRGCYWGKCTFCTIPQGIAYRKRSMKLVGEDLASLQKQLGTKVVYMAADAIDPPDCRELSNEILSRGLEVYWGSEVIFDRRFDADTLRLMHRAGCRTLLFGLESANARVLKAMKKGTTIPKIVEILEGCRDAGIAAVCQTFAGFPGETRDEALETARFLIAHKDSVRGVSPSPRFFLEPKTEIYQHPERFGITRIGDANTDFGFVHFEYEANGGMPYEEVPGVTAEMQRMLADHFDFRVRYIGAEGLLYFAHFGTAHGLAKDAARSSASEPPRETLLVREPGWDRVETRLNVDAVYDNLLEHLAEGGSVEALHDEAEARRAGHALALEVRDRPVDLWVELAAHQSERFFVVTEATQRRLLELLRPAAAARAVRATLLAEGATARQIDDAIEQLVDAGVIAIVEPEPEELPATASAAPAS